MAKAKKKSGSGKAYGIERSGLGYGVNEGKLPFAFPTKELANEWLQFSAKLGADFGTYACSGGLCQDDYSVVESDFCYAKVDSPDAEKDYYLQEFKLVDVSGLPVLSCKPSEMTVEQAKELLDFLFIDDDEAESDRMGIYASRLLRCLNTADKDAYNNGYEMFDPTCCYWDEEAFILPEGIAEIGEMEYQCARNLESIVIPEGVAKIGRAAFYHCRKLKMVKFPSTLKEIEEKAFYGCDAIEKLQFPDGLEKVGTDAFPEKWYGEKKIVECSDFSTLSEYSWRELLVKHPELGDRCTCWDKFDSSDWEDILKDAPQFAAKCKKWSKFSGYEIVRILEAQPQLVSKWKSLSKLDADDWSSLLRERPEFADRCTKWNKFTASNWSQLLAEQPQFADKCKVWPQFEDVDWDRVVKKGAKFKALRKKFGPKQLSGYPADYVRGEAKGLYCVIDVSGGKDAAKFAVSYLDAIPAGGWSDEYKTSKIVLRLVAPMTFSMGTEGEDDNPVHQVKLTMPYYIGVFEVTQKQWELVMGHNPSSHDDKSDSAVRPVEQVSYRKVRGEKQGLKWPNSACVDKDSFLGILRKKSGIKNIDLPTEAEWTCACKSGIGDIERPTRGLFFATPNQNAIEGIAWTEDNSDEETHPVGELAPNGLGLYDVLGNVWEWCIDRYGTFPKSKVTDPIGYSVSSKFVSHGSCCYNGLRSMNSAIRNSDSASKYASGLGLRLGITLEKASKELLQKASEIKEVKILGNWEKLSVWEWCNLLEEQPQFADKCNKWDAFNAFHWSCILSKQPQFSNKCEKWMLFDRSDWSRLLACQPQFVNECDACNAWCELGACHWSRLIAAQPQFAVKCDKWKIFDDDDWANVLSAQPQLFDLFKSAHAFFHGGAWLKVLQKQPQLARGKVDWLGDKRDARDLIIVQPQFADQCEKFKYMDDIDLALLAAAKICEDRFLKVKNPSSWAVAIALSGNPTLANKVKVSRVMNDVAEEIYDRLWNDDGLKVSPWASPAAFLLRNQPAFINDIDVSKFTCEDWLCVLQKQPQFADKCDWENFEKKWDGDSHAAHLDTDEIRSLVRKNTHIDVTEGVYITDYVSSPMLMKRFDSSDWRDPAYAWCEVLCKHPEKAADFESDHFTVKPEEKSAEQHDDGKLHIDFYDWNDWGESTWKSYEQKLMLNDEALNKQFDEKWCEALEDCGNFEQTEFLAYACKRNACWSFLVSWEWGCMIDTDLSLLENPILVKRIVKWCDECEEEDGYYTDDDCCLDDDSGGTMNRWAYVLMKAPRLAVHCSTLQKFNGYSRCMLLAKQPQFADKFALEELGDPHGKCWSNCSSDDYEGAWEYLVGWQPEFAKYRKG